MADFDVTLGGFTFAGFEVPDRIPFGVDQQTNTHKFVGGKRVIDSMGRDDPALTWEGRFTGPDALSRALQLKAMAVAGGPLTLTWSELSYTVVLKSFAPDFEKAYLIPYRITLEVQADNSAPAGAATDSLDDQLGSDFDDADGYGDDIGDATLSGSLTSLGSALSGVSTFVGATQAVLSAATQPLGQAQAQVNTLIAAGEAKTGGDFTGDAATLAAFVTGQTAAFESLTPLYGAQASLGRIAVNLSDVTTAGARQTQAGGNLYAVAAQAYADPGQWPVIAQANGLTDPVLSGVNTITIPPAQASRDGVLQS